LARDPSIVGEVSPTGHRKGAETVIVAIWLGVQAGFLSVSRLMPVTTAATVHFD